MCVCMHAPSSSGSPSNIFHDGPDSTPHRHRVNVLVTMSRLLHFVDVETSSWWLGLLPSIQNTSSGKTNVHMYVAVNDAANDNDDYSCKATNLQTMAATVPTVFSAISTCTVVQVTPLRHQQRQCTTAAADTTRIRDWKVLLQAISMPFCGCNNSSSSSSEEEDGGCCASSGAPNTGGDKQESIVVLVDDSSEFTVQNWDISLANTLLFNDGFGSSSAAPQNTNSNYALLRLVPLQLTASEFPEADELVRCGPFLHYQHNTSSAAAVTNVAFLASAHRAHFGGRRRNKHKEDDWWWSSIATLMGAYGILNCLAWLPEPILARNLACWNPMPHYGEQATMLHGVNVAVETWPRNRRAHLVDILHSLQEHDQHAAAHYIATGMLHTKPAFKLYQRIAMRTLRRVWRECPPNNRVSAMITSPSSTAAAIQFD